MAGLAIRFSIAASLCRAHGSGAIGIIEHGGQKTKDEGFEGGNAGADDADVDLDGAPHQGQGGIPGKVSFAAKTRTRARRRAGWCFADCLLQIVDSDDIHNSDENTKGKSED